MKKKHSHIINWSKFFKKFAAVLSLFALASVPAEAVRTPKTKKTIIRQARHGIAKRSPVRHRATRARVSTRKAAGRVVRGVSKRAPARAMVHPTNRRAQQHAAALAQQQAIALAQQQAAALAQQAIALAQQQEAARLEAVRQARIAAIRQERQEERRLLVAGKGNFDTRPFVKQNRSRSERDAFANYVNVPFQICDLGYEAVPGHAPHMARTAQYTPPGTVHNVMNLPAAPVFHPYHPGNGNNLAVLAPAFLLNIKAADYQDTLLQIPPAIRAVIQHNLAGIADYNIESYIGAQCLEYWAGEIWQFKPHYWLKPDAPYDSAQAYAHNYTVKAGVFAHDPNIRLQGQPVNGLVVEPAISIHNGGPGTANVSSGDVLPVANFNNPNLSQILWYYTETLDERTGDRRAAFGRQVFLKPADMEAAMFLVDNANAGRQWRGSVVTGGATDLRDLQNKIGALHRLPAGNAARRFEDLNLAELF